MNYCTLSMAIINGMRDTIQWYDENATEYATAGKDLTFHTGIEKFTSYLLPGSKVLDAGCGAGRDSQVLHAMGLHVTGVDLSEGLLKEARKRCPDVNFVLGDLLDLPFENESFDGVWAHASLVHLETIQQAQKVLLEFHRVLKSNGVVYMMVKQQMGSDKTAVVSDTLSNHDRFFQYYNKEELVALVEKAQLTTLFIVDDVDDRAGRSDTKWIWLIARKTT